MTTTQSTDYNIIVMSDPQPWRLDLDNNDPNNDQSRWETTVKSVRDSIQTLHREKSFAFGIINGDLTEFGRRSQRESFRTLFAPSPLGFNTYVGLGNHDYQNNVGDCAEPSNADYSMNACARGMVFDMHYRIEEYRNYATSGNFRYDSSEYSGSKAYSWEYGDIHFVQLQNYPTYHVVLDHWAASTINVTDSIDWLEKDLIQARNRNKTIILNFHDGNQHFPEKSSQEELTFFKYMLEHYGVKAVFVGHTHYVGQDNRYGGSEIFGDVPVYNSGALFKGDYLAVEIHGTELSITVYNGLSGTPQLIEKWN
ncbi:metallophosphoesterase [Proteus mirabilis]|uniref:Putative phosphoesterase n=1 Tax=Proteus mirabilis TaxID=584 RepID=A0A5P1J1V5_PROMI|nr:metallophosphoesterase [Proteus mirabilis]AZH00435.1 phosphoesterase [Proteus mirabilis]MBG2991284.1 metallophosphoesterase [Proteus mirabilis]MBS3855928.1 metallophosphoesterase [Proteus mirabilis]MCI9768690.1 metallophosphoesterase [Proteus mirabilis]MCI9772280.1 metallophosphoesterase [Proteus mirabilis]